MNNLVQTLSPAVDRWHDHDGPWPWFPIIPLIFIAIWVAVLVIFRRRWRDGGPRSGQAVLAERFARGEIDEAEYRQRQQVLKHR